MQIDLMKALPLYFREVKDFIAIMETEGAELEKVENAMIQLNANNFILTADLQTLAYYEKLLKIRYISGSVEERRKNVLLQWNLLIPYTLPKLKEVLDEIVGEENVFLKCRYDTYQLELQILNQETVVLRNIFDTVFKMIPAHIELLLSGRYRGKYRIPINYSNAIRFRTEFFPRYSLAGLSLNAGWRLDGMRRLNGYDGENPIDFYPARIRVRTAASEDIRTAGRLRVVGGTEEEIKTETVLRMPGGAAKDIRTGEQSHIRAEAGISIETDSYMTKRNQLDAAWRLGGSRKLDGGRYIL